LYILNFKFLDSKLEDETPSIISSIITEPIGAPRLMSAGTCFSSRSLVLWPRIFHVRLTVTEVAEDHFLSQYTSLAPDSIIPLALGTHIHFPSTLRRLHTDSNACSNN